MASVENRVMAGVIAYAGVMGKCPGVTGAHLCGGTKNAFALVSVRLWQYHGIAAGGDAYDCFSMTSVSQRGSLLRGMAWMFLSALSFTIETTLMKMLGPEWPAGVQMVWRQSSALLLLLPLIVHQRRTIFSVSRPWLIVVRSLATTAGLLCSIHAVSHLPLATANAMSFIRPLLVAALAVLLLGERFGRWRALAIGLGFSGVIVMAAPSITSADPLPYATAFGAAVFFAISIISIKSMSADHNPYTMTVYGSLLGLVFAMPFALLHWRWPDPTEMLMLFGIGAASIGTALFYVYGFANADASLMGNMDYLRLPLAAIAGIIFFSDWPTQRTIIGSAIIIAAVILLSYAQGREKPALPVGETG